MMGRRIEEKIEVKKVGRSEVGCGRLKKAKMRISREIWGKLSVHASSRQGLQTGERSASLIDYFAVLKPCCYLYEPRICRTRLQ